MVKTGSDWHCVMCNISLDDAVKQLNNPLTMDIDAYLNDDTSGSAQYVFDRTCARPRKTCGKVCGWNYISWSRTHDPKSSYTKDIFDCFLCKKTSEGGRILVAGKKKVKVCRSCHRKQTTKALRQMWEELHREERNQYRNQWAKDNPGKVRRAKRKARKKAGVPVYGAKRKNMWSYKYKECTMCHSTRLKHRAKGLCRTCYYIVKRQTG
jgi:hypothetical protein